MEVQHVVEHFVSPHDLAKTGQCCVLESGVHGSYAAVSGSGISNGTNIVTWHYVKQANLEWFVKPSENEGFYYIVSALDLNQDRVLHQHGGREDCTLWERVNQGNTQVKFEDAGHGYWYLVYGHSGKAVHLYGGVGHDGAMVTQHAIQDSPNLKWRFAVAPKDPKEFVDHDISFTLESGVNGYFAYVVDESLANGTNIAVSSYNNSPNMRWHLKTAETQGYYYIISDLDRGHDRVLHQYGGSHDDGGNVTLWERVNQGNTQVKFEDAGHGYVYIVFGHSGKCVHLHGGVGFDGANVTQWTVGESPNRIWRLSQVHH